MLLNLFDVDRSGTIGFPEFSGLWTYIKEWQGIFRAFGRASQKLKLLTVLSSDTPTRTDRDRSGSIDAQELGAALTQFGYTLPPHLVQTLEKKYS